MCISNKSFKYTRGTEDSVKNRQKTALEKNVNEEKKKLVCVVLTRVFLRKFILSISLSRFISYSLMTD